MAEWVATDGAYYGFRAGIAPRPTRAAHSAERGQALECTALPNLAGNPLVDATEAAADVTYRNSLLGDAVAYDTEFVKGETEVRRQVVARKSPVDYGPDVRAQVCEFAEYLVRDEAGDPILDRHGRPMIRQVVMSRKTFYGQLSVFHRAFPDAEDRIRRGHVGIYGGQERKVFLLGPG